MSTPLATIVMLGPVASDVVFSVTTGVATTGLATTASSARAVAGEKGMAVAMMPRSTVAQGR